MLVEALSIELKAHGHDLPVYFGNRHWHPFLADTVKTMSDDGVTHAAVFVTSAFGSYSGCRQYREALEEVTLALGPSTPRLDKLRLFYNHPGFLHPLAERIGQCLAERPEARMIFTAHSIPVSMAQGCDYTQQLDEAATILLELAGHTGRPYDLVYQSRSGPPQIPWLEPDINDHLESLAQEGISEVALLPLGFVSDHMEVLFDLDTQAAATASRLGLGFTRLQTVGVAPPFVSMIRELIEERYLPTRPTPVALGSSGPWPDMCPEGHCPAPKRRPARSEP